MMTEENTIKLFQMIGSDTREFIKKNTDRLFKSIITLMLTIMLSMIILFLSLFNNLKNNQEKIIQTNYIIKNKINRLDDVQNDMYYYLMESETREMNKTISIKDQKFFIDFYKTKKKKCDRYRDLTKQYSKNGREIYYTECYNIFYNKPNKIK